jgi:hypothetical protein
VAFWAKEASAVGFLREAEGLIEGRYRIGGALEGEQLKVLGQSSEYDLGPQNMIGFLDSRWSGDVQLYAQPPQVGSWADLELPVPEAGKYEVIVYLTKACDYGIVQFHLDGMQLGKPLDGFQAREAVSLGKYTGGAWPAVGRGASANACPPSRGGPTPAPPAAATRARGTRRRWPARARPLGR